MVGCVPLIYVVQNASCRECAKSYSSPGEGITVKKDDPRAVEASIVERDGDEPLLAITLRNGTFVRFAVSRIKSFRLRPVPRKALATRAAELCNVKVSDDGFTVEWPTLNVSFDVAEMLPEYLGFGMSAVALSRRAGRVKSPVKAATSAANGRKSAGRPRGRRKIAA